VPGVATTMSDVTRNSTLTRRRSVEAATSRPSVQRKTPTIQTAPTGPRPSATGSSGVPPGRCGLGDRRSGVGYSRRGLTARTIVQPACSWTRCISRTLPAQESLLFLPARGSEIIVRVCRELGCGAARRVGRNPRDCQASNGDK